MALGVQIEDGVSVTAAPAEVTCAIPGFDMWCRALAHAIAHNDGLSVHLGGALFDDNVFNGNDAMQGFDGLDFSLGPVQLSPTTLSRLSPLHSQVWSNSHTHCDTIWQRLGVELHAADVGAGPALLAATGGDLASFTAALTNLASPKSQKQQERKDLLLETQC